MNDFWYKLAGVLLGAAISVVVSYHFARRGSAELRQEAEDVRHYVDALISYLEAAGMIRVVRDEDGRPIETTIVRLSPAVIKTESGAVGTITVSQEDATPEQGDEAPRS